MGELENRLKRAPTDDEISAEIGITDERVPGQPEPIPRSSVAALDELWTISSSGGDTVSLIDTIEDPHADDPSRRWPAPSCARRWPTRSAAARAREARHHALLLRGADAPRDRRGPRGHRVARLAAAHQGRAAAEGAAAGLPRARAARAAVGSPRPYQAAAGRHRIEGLGTRRQEVRQMHAPDKIRNVALLGHRGTGKTSVGEALLFQSGTINRLGSVAEGTTVADLRRRRAATRHVDLVRTAATASGTGASST